MSDLTTIAGLLADLISEIQGLRSDFNEFTGYNTTKMSDIVSELLDPSGSNLGDVVSEMQGMRSDFNEFTGYNTTKMSDAVSEITGPSGYHLGDIFTAIGSLEPAVDLK
ncbi:MAG: hypothetical protein ACK4ZW_11815 [Blastomonas sp.]